MTTQNSFVYIRIVDHDNFMKKVSLLFTLPIVRGDMLVRPPNESLDNKNTPVFGRIRSSYNFQVAIVFCLNDNAAIILHLTLGRNRKLRDCIIIFLFSAKKISHHLKYRYQLGTHCKAKHCRKSGFTMQNNLARLPILRLVFRHT